MEVALHLRLETAIKLKIFGWIGKPAIADTTKTTAHLRGHMIYTHTPAVC